MFGVIPFFPGLGAKGIHSLLQEVQDITFDALLILLVIHVAFHLWRHYIGKDNALRIMAPKALHRYL